jgi:hypothetical protein
MTEGKRTGAEERAYAELDLEIWDLERTVKHNRRKAEFIPADWHQLQGHGLWRPPAPEYDHLVG